MRRYLLVALWPAGLAAITAATALAARRSPQPPGRAARDARIPHAAGPEPPAATGQDRSGTRARHNGLPEITAPDQAPVRSREPARADLTARDILRFGAVTGAGAAASYGVMRALGPVIMSRGPAIDEPVYRWTVGHQVAGWAAIIERLNKLGNSWTIWGAAGTGAACLSVTWPRQKWLPPTALAGAVIADKYVTLALRRTFSRVGPPGSPLGTYPSGGCERAILFYGLIAGMLWREFSGSRRGKVWATGAVAALAFDVAYCRGYLSKHWLTDILSGLLYGVVLLAPFLAGIRLVAGPAGPAWGEDRPAVTAPTRLNLAAALISPEAKLTGDARLPGRKHMQGRRHILAAAVAVTAASAALAGIGAGVASAAPAPAGRAASGPAGRTVLASTAPPAGTPVRAMVSASRVRVSVFIGRDRAGLAAAALAVSDPASQRYRHFLTPAQVRARYGATTAQQAAVSRWLTGSGLVVTHRDGFVIAAAGTAASAAVAVAAPLTLSRPRGGVPQILPVGAMSVPASIASSIATIRVAPAVAPMGPHEPMKQPPTTALVPGGSTVKEACSAYYGQKKASLLPGAYGRTLTWAPCGYLPTQLRHAYGATQAGLTGHGVSIAIISDDNDTSALADANRWAKARGFPPFAPGQFSADIAPHAANGLGDIESALDVESAHGMAPAARLSYVVGNGTITGDRLLDPLDTIVSQHIADVVSSSWFEGYMPVPHSMITAWEGVLQRAAVEGITVNFATGDYGDTTPLQYPGSDPWITTVGGTSLAVGAHGSYLWEAGWETDESVLADHATTWKPAPPGSYREGSTGGVSKTFAEPYYQRGVVSGNVVGGHPMRVVPDVSALGDWNLGYQIGVSVQVGAHMIKYFNEVNGGTSLSSPMFTGFEADLIQGRGGIALGFANPLLYDLAGTRAFHDITGNPQGQGFTEAVVYGPAYQQNPPSLASMGECGSTKHLSCGPGYDTVSGLGSPGPTFFSSFGSHPNR